MGDEQPKVSVIWVLWLIFCGFVVYGTTIPFDFSSGTLHAKISAINWIPFIDRDEGGLASISDMVQNVILFLPFGVLATFRSSGGWGWALWWWLRCWGACSA